jgi:hypothetical protein
MSGRNSLARKLRWRLATTQIQTLKGIKTMIKGQVKLRIGENTIDTTTGRIEERLKNYR